MTASEFAFLALGLVLGVASGAALVEVLRSRPPSRREIRVTVAHNSIPRRATTLTEAETLDRGPARGGPADRRWVDRDMPPPDEPGIPTEATPAISPIDPVTVPVARGGAPLPTDESRTPVPSAAPPGPLRFAAAGASGSPWASAARRASRGASFAAR